MLSKFLAVAAIAGTTFAQTSTTCDPTKKSCPDDPALGKSVFYDLTKGAPQDFTVSTGAAPTFDDTGAVFTIAKSMQAPTMSSKWYMMFGHYDVVMKAAPGQGIVSSLVLLSDDLDEVDWEFLGSDDSQVQSNYYGKGNTEVYDRGANLSAAAGTQDDFHTYSVDWTADHITWAIDGQVLRTLTPETADKNQYPQSPMQLKIGTWPAGDPSEPKGTIEWAGGEVDYTKGPFVMTVKSIKAIDYSTGESYSYGDMSGDWQSIQAKNGKVNSSGNSGAAASTATGSGTAVTASTSGGISVAPITATTTVSGVLSSATGALAPHTTTGSNSTVSSAAPTGSSGSTMSTAASTGASTGTTPSSTSSGVPTQSSSAAGNIKPVAFGLLAGLFALVL